MRKYPETKAVAGSQKLLSMMETSMNSGACEIPIDKHDFMDLTGTTYF